MNFLYVREFTEDEVKLLEEHVPSVKQWIDDAIIGKLAHCRDKTIQQEVKRHIEENLNLPKTATELITRKLSAPDYKNRRERIILEEENDNKPASTPIRLSPKQSADDSRATS